MINSALFYHNHKQGTNFLSSYSFIFCLPRFPFAWNQALHEHNYLSPPGDSQTRIVKETMQLPSSKYSISVFVNPSAYSKHNAPEERQGVHTGKKEIFFSGSATAFQITAQQPQRKVNKQRQQLGVRSQSCGRESDRSSLPTGKGYLCSSSKFFRFTFSNSVFCTIENSISDSDCWGLCLCCYLSVSIQRFAFLALKLNHSIVFGTELGETFPNNGYTRQLPVNERVQFQENFKSKQAENSVGILLAF